MIPVDEMLAQAKTMAATAGRKTEELVELAKLRVQIAEKRREIADLYEGLGRLVYDSRISGESVEELVEVCVAALGEEQKDLARLEERVMLSKSVIRCDACGAVNMNNAVFCNQCGEEFRR